MRKLLLAASALAGVMGVAGGANAASLSPNAPNPAPGSITVTFNALVESFFFLGQDDQAKRADQALGQKYQNVAIGTYARLYPSFDGVLANGLKYGGAMEIRQNAAVSSPETVNGSPTFYAQREYVYVGADRAGRFYFGSQVPPTELFQVGNPVNFNDGGWDGDLPGFFVNGGIPYFIDDTNDRQSKLMYVSPQFFGFDFAVSYAGNDVGNSMNASTRLSQDTTLSNAGLRKNIIDGAIRYQGTFGPVGFKANIGATTATPINPCPIDAACPTLGGGSGFSRRNYSLYAGGISLTFAGFEVDAHVDTGIFGPSETTILTGSTGTTAWIAGLSYTVGPIIVGASYYGFESGYLKGNGTPTQGVGGLNGYGVAAGGTYTLAPGASIFLDYLYGHQKANGWDFAADGLAGAPGPNHNSVNSNGMGIGMAFKW
jgi:hypothetical protein